MKNWEKKFILKKNLIKEIWKKRGKGKYRKLKRKKKNRKEYKKIREMWNKNDRTKIKKEILYILYICIYKIKNDKGRDNIKILY